MLAVAESSKSFQSVALFPSYESFLGTVHTMMVQYSKFNKMVGSMIPLVILFGLTQMHCRPAKLPGEKTSAASTILKPEPGPDKNTTASRTKTHLSLALSSI